MKRKNKGDDYEKMVQEIYQCFLNYNGNDEKLGNIDVQHNITLIGKSGATHQIDVYWEFERAGIKYKTIVEVKDWSTPVKKEQLLSFHSVLQDIPGNPNGIYVSKSGFQSGAEIYGKAHGIELIQISNDVKSRVFTILCRFITTHYQNVGVIVQGSEKPESIELIERLKICAANQKWEEMVILDPNGQKYFLSELVYEDAKPYYSNPEGEITEFKKDLDVGWFWELKDDSKEHIPIVGYAFNCQNTWEEYGIRIPIDNFADHIVTYVLSKKDFYYNSKEQTVIPY